MFSSIRTLLLVTAIAGVMALLSPVAHAKITITRAEVQWGDAVVMGRGAAAKDYIFWEDEPEPVTRANKRGKFSFESEVVPASCVGALHADSDPEITPVPLSNCTQDSGEPGPIPKPLVEYWTQQEAHMAMRCVQLVSPTMEKKGPGSSLVVKMHIYALGTCKT